ncbi:MAG: hypothetical protein JWO44_1485 [Bacteroidetes bacterium]|nr:hypothetical protein [Bacteroidota bacterium]
MKKIIFQFLILAFTALSLNAQHWTGNISSDWNNSANWSAWPLNGNNITIDPLTYSGIAASPVISAASVFTPDKITIQNGAVLSIQNNLSTGDDINILGTGTHVNISSGIISVAPGNNGRFIISDGASVTMSNGTLNTDQRLLVELGGIFTLSGGQVNVGEVLALSDGNADGSSLFNMNGGTVTTGVELAFENELGLYFPTFNMSAGTLSVNGDVTWFGTAPGSGAGGLISTGGNVVVSGNVLNLPASTINLHIHAGGTAAISISGALIDMNQAADTLLQSGSSSLTLLGTNSWNNHGTVLSEANTFFGGNSTLTGTGSFVFHNLNIAGLRSLSHAAPATITVTGDFMNNGTFNANSNGVIFAGAFPQTIGGSSSTAFHNLTANHSSTGITLARAQSISGMLTLTSGVIFTDATNLLTLKDNATSASGSDSSFVNGPMKKTGNDAFVFPAGKNGKWRRLAMTAPLNATAEFTVEYFDSGYSTAGPVIAPLTGVSTLEYWNVEQAVTSDPYHVELYWEDASMSSLSCADLAMAHWDGTAWTVVPATAFGTCSGSGNGLLSADTLVAGNGPFTFGSTAVTTGISSIDEKGQRMKVYPNPISSAGQLTISAPFAIERIEISDLSGRIVLQRDNLTPGILQLNNTLSPGMYYIIVKGNTQQSVQKLVVR